MADQLSYVVNFKDLSLEEYHELTINIPISLLMSFYELLQLILEKPVSCETK